METQNKPGACDEGSGEVILGNAPGEWSFLPDAGDRLGFCAVGVAAAAPIPRRAREIFDAWTGRGGHASMTFLERHLPERLDPRSDGILPGATAVVCAALPYGDGSTEAGIWGRVARHARGRDYHATIKERLRLLASKIAEAFPSARTRVFADTAPVMERSWAVLAGIGEIGRSGALLVPGHGPLAVLGEVVCAGVPSPSPAFAPSRGSTCRDCGSCVAACPTGALGEDGTVRADRCLSYQTIENRDAPIPESLADDLELVFGCDSCTASCPAAPRNDRRCALDPPPSPDAGPADPSAISEMDARSLERIISETALERTGAQKIISTAAAVRSRRKEER